MLPAILCDISSNGLDVLTLDVPVKFRQSLLQIMAVKTTEKLPIESHLFWARGCKRPLESCTSWSLLLQSCCGPPSLPDPPTLLAGPQTPTWPVAGSNDGLHAEPAYTQLFWKRQDVIKEGMITTEVECAVDPKMSAPIQCHEIGTSRDAVAKFYGIDFGRTCSESDVSRVCIHSHRWNARFCTCK